MDQKEATQNSRDWSNLPPVLLELIFKRLIFSDQVRFGSVCKLWFWIASTKPYPPVPEFPWLLLRDSHWTSQEQYEFFSFQEKRTYKVDKLPESPNLGNVRGFFQGWFFTQFQSGHKFYLLNPFSKVKIQLPDHLTLRLNYPSMEETIKANYLAVTDASKAVVLSSKHYAIVAVLLIRGDLALCKVGDSEWCCPKNHPLYADITFYNGKLYALHRTGVNVLIVDDALIPCLVHKINIPMEHYCERDIYLVESGRDLLVVKRYYEIITGLTNQFKVFKLEENQTTTNLSDQVLTNLSNQVLLVLARYSTLSVSAEMFPGLKGNQITFIQDGGDLAVFSLEDGSIKSFPTPISNFPLVYPLCIKPMHQDVICNCA